MMFSVLILWNYGATILISDHGDNPAECFYPSRNASENRVELISFPQLRFYEVRVTSPLCLVSNVKARHRSSPQLINPVRPRDKEKTPAPRLVWNTIFSRRKRERGLVWREDVASFEDFIIEPDIPGIPPFVVIGPLKCGIDIFHHAFAGEIK